MRAQTGNVLQLRIESTGNLPFNHYRICEGRVQMRLLDPAGHWASGWRTLDRNEIQLHHALRTVVWKWLRVRLGSETSALDKAA